MKNVRSNYLRTYTKGSRCASELLFNGKGLFTPSESRSKSEKDQRLNGKHQRKFKFPFTFVFYLI